MKSLRMLVMVVVVLVGGGNVFGDMNYTVDDFVSEIACTYDATNTYHGADFTLDGLSPNENVYIIGLSNFLDGMYLNVAGYNVGGETFTFKVYGDGKTSRPISELYVILDNGDENLFSIGKTTGELTVGLPGEDAFLGNDDIVLSSINVSINGGAFGDISAISYVPGQSFESLDSMAIIIPEPATILLLGFGGLTLIKKKRRKG